MNTSKIYSYFVATTKRSRSTFSQYKIYCKTEILRNILFFHHNWRASEAKETLLGKSEIYVYVYIYIWYVQDTLVAWSGGM